MSDDTLKPGESIKPELTVDEAKKLLLSIYNLQCAAIEPLPGYDDVNYKVTIDDDDGAKRRTYVFKVMNKCDSRNVDFVEGTNDLLLFLGRFFVISPFSTRQRSTFKRFKRTKFFF